MTPNTKVRLSDEPDKNPTRVGYDHLPGPEPFTPESPEWVRYQAALEHGHGQLSKVSDPISGSYSLREDPSYRSTQEPPIRSLRKRCTGQSVGSILKQDTGFQFVWGPCGKCGHCREWERIVDAARLDEVWVTKPVLFYLDEDDWSRYGTRLKRRDGAHWKTVPIKDGKRAVITDAADVWEGASEPVSDLAAVLEELEARRDRKDDRRASTGGHVRSRKTLETEIYEKEPAERIGFWNTRAIGIGERDQPWDIREKIAGAVEEYDLKPKREGAGVLVEAHRHDPRMEVLLRRMQAQMLPKAVPWQEGGAPPKRGEPGFSEYQRAMAQTKVGAFNIDTGHLRHGIAQLTEAAPTAWNQAHSRTLSETLAGIPDDEPPIECYQAELEGVA